VANDPPRGAPFAQPGIPEPELLPEPGLARVSSFGHWLRRHREMRALSLDCVIAETRLPARIVLALEEDNPYVLGDRSYALQYVRAVALVVGLDVEDAALRYEEWLQQLPPNTMPPPPREPASGIERAMRPLERLVQLPRKISTDPMVWIVVGITAAVIAVLLVKR
jgi:cytoskeletal protein RodZ